MRVPMMVGLCAAMALAGCGDEGVDAGNQGDGGAAGDAAVDGSATRDGGGGGGACVALEGAAGLLPEYGQHTAPSSGVNVEPDMARDAVVLARRVRPGMFSDGAPELPRGAHDSDGAILGGRWYLLGGQLDRFNGEASLLVSDQQPDGTFGDWREGTAFMFGIIDHIVLAHAGRMYLTGGGQALGMDRFRQQVAAYSATPTGGDIPTWQRGPDNPMRRFGHEAVIAAGYLYTLVGDDGFDAHDDVSVAPILPDGTIGAWVRTTPIPGGALQFLAGAGTSRHLWALGGCRNKNCSVRSNIERRVWVADINPDGTLSAWREAGEMPVANYNQKVVMAGGRIVMAGGRAGGTSRCGDVGGDNYRNVWWADINPDGTLGAWQGGAEAGGAMPRVRSDFVMRVDHRDQLWIVGGRTACQAGETRAFNTDYPRTVWRAPWVREEGVAREGAWLSGPMRAPEGQRLATLRVDVMGAGATVRVRHASAAEPNVWSAWSAPWTGASVPAPDGAAAVQVMVEMAGDGAASPTLRAVRAECAPR